MANVALEGPQVAVERHDRAAWSDSLVTNSESTIGNPCGPKSDDAPGAKWILKPILAAEKMSTSSRVLLGYVWMLSPACSCWRRTIGTPKVVFYKPSGWEVYGGHNQLQLMEVAQRLFGRRALFDDVAHHHGFLTPAFVGEVRWVSSILLFWRTKWMQQIAVVSYSCEHIGRR